MINHQESKLFMQPRMQYSKRQSIYQELDANKLINNLKFNKNISIIKREKRKKEKFTSTMSHRIKMASMNFHTSKIFK